jgi:hypothetical protein
MANTVIGASVEVEFESIGQVRKAIKDATSDLLRMQEAFGKTSPQAIDAARRVAELRDRINDAKEQADLFDPGNKFKAFSNAASQVAAGFSAVQGAMALVGEESDDLQKTLVKVQGAMALSQGLSQIGDLGKAFDELKIVGVRAFTALKTAIGSTGIGLLVIALGAIVAYWDDIKAAVSGVSEEQKKLNKQSEANLNTQKEKLDAIGSQENILKLQGKSEKDILKLKIGQTDEAIKAAEINIKNSIETQKAQVAAAKRNKEILQGLIAFVSLPITAVLKGIDLIGQAVGKNFDLYGKFSGGLASLVFDPEKTEKEGQADIKAQQKALDDLKNQRAGFQLQINDIDKKGNEKRTADNKKTNDERINAEKDLTKFIEDENNKRLTSTMTASEKELFEIRKLYDEKIAIAQKFNLNTSELEGLRLKAITDVINKEQAGRRDNADFQKTQQEKQLNDFKAQVPKIGMAQSQITANLQTESNTRKSIAEDEANNRIQLTQAIGTALGSLSDVVGRETAAGKALAIAQATINTFLGITEVWKSKAVLPEPFNTATKIAATITTAAGGFAAVRNIAKTKVPGGGGGPTPPPPPPPGNLNAPLSPILSPALTGQALNAEAINNLGNNAMRAYVLNSDIQNNDQRNAYLQRNARIG